MGKFDAAKKATEEMFAEEIAEQVECKTIPKGEKPENHNKQMGENKMEKVRNKKSHILVAAYVFLIIVELFFYVPYHNIQMFKTNQNVPYTEIVGNGYTTMDDIANDNAYIDYHNRTSTGKIVNTPQLFLNVSITTVLAIIIYFLSRKDEKIKEMPILDVNSLAFATEEEVAQAQRDYAIKMAEYIKGKGGL